MAVSFEAIVEQERERLNEKRKDLLRQRKALDGELAAIDKEMGAVNAYYAAKTGRAVSGGTRARRGSRQEAIKKIIADSADGVTRGDILAEMNVRGDKSAEQSVSNALANMKKAGKVTAKDGRYFAA